MTELIYNYLDKKSKNKLFIAVCKNADIKLFDELINLIDNKNYCLYNVLMSKDNDFINYVIDKYDFDDNILLIGLHKASSDDNFDIMLKIYNKMSNIDVNKIVLIDDDYFVKQTWNFLNYSKINCMKFLMKKCDINDNNLDNLICLKIKKQEFEEALCVMNKYNHFDYDKILNTICKYLDYESLIKFTTKFPKSKFNAKNIISEIANNKNYIEQLKIFNYFLKLDYDFGKIPYNDLSLYIITISLEIIYYIIDTYYAGSEKKYKHLFIESCYYTNLDRSQALFKRCNVTTKDISNILDYEEDIDDKETKKWLLAGCPMSHTSIKSARR